MGALTWLLVVVALALNVASCTGGGSGAPVGGAASSVSQGGAGAGASTGTTTPTTAEAWIATSPASGPVADIPLDYVLRSPAAATVDIDVEYSTDAGLAWFPATRGPGAEGTSALSSTPAGAPHRFVWASSEDLRATAQKRVKLRVTPRAPAGVAPALPTETARFELDGAQVAAPVKLKRYPYVQNIVGDRATIVWHTTAPAQGHVLYGPTPALGASATPPSGAAATRFEVELQGLQPGTTMYYRVFANGLPLGPGEHFRAAPDSSAQGFRFAVFGDSGKGTQGQFDVARQVQSFEPDMLLHTGDVIYDYGEASNYDPRFFVPYRDIARRAPFFMSIGNHDILSGFGDPYVDAFVLPRNTRDNGEKYYSFDYGNARFISLDTAIGFILPGGGQHIWLIDELNRPRPDWLFVFFHFAPYSTGDHGSSQTLRYLVSPLFEQAGVDVVFTGHDHHFERSKPVKDFVRNGPGTVYYVTGGGGSTRSVSGNAAWSAASEASLHFLGCEITGRTLRVDAIRDDGSTIDTFTINK